MRKNKTFRISFGIFCVLAIIMMAIFAYACSPWHPRNLTDSTVIEKGTQYTVKLNGISKYSEEGFVPVADGFYKSSGKNYICENEDGFARITDTSEEGEYLLGKYFSLDVNYEDFEFCSEKYINRQELEGFFSKPDPIYNFDYNKIPEYVSDVIAYEKKFHGSIKIKLYRGRFVITEFYIGEEKVLEHNCIE